MDQSKGRIIHVLRRYSTLERDKCTHIYTDIDIAPHRDIHIRTEKKRNTQTYRHRDTDIAPTRRHTHKYSHKKRNTQTHRYIHRHSPHTRTYSYAQTHKEKYTDT